MRDICYKIFTRCANSVALIVLLLVFALCFYATVDALLANGESSAKRYAKYQTLGEAFRDAQALNSEVIGWVKLNDSGLSQPIVQGQDNAFYLTHDYSKKPSAGGAAFLDAMCKPYMNEGVPIVYGHNMEGNSMFGAIKRYADYNFMTSHSQGCICIQGEWRYVNVRMLLQCSESERTLYSCYTDADKGKFFNTAKNYVVQSLNDFEMDEDIIGLSTCIENGLKRNILIITIGETDSTLENEKIN